MNTFLHTGAARWLVLVMIGLSAAGTLAAGLSWSAGTGTVHLGAATDFTPHGTQPGLAHGIGNSDACAGCHSAWDTASPGHGFMPYNTWAGSMMAHAARDPLFWAAVDVANADIPGVGDYCLRCHTPTGWLEGRVRKTTIGTIIDGANGCHLIGQHDEPEYMSGDYAGLTCNFCHRLTETGPAGEIAPPGSGNFWIDDANECTNSQGTSFGEPCKHGPYDYAHDDPRVPHHGWVYSSFLDRGAVCGVCHDVTTPITDAGPARTLILPDGSDSLIPMPIERTFMEWRHSDFADVIFRDRLGDDLQVAPYLARGATCQDCHMANSEDPTAQACTLTEPGSRAGELPVHEFVGANTWVPAIIRGEYAAGLDDGFSTMFTDALGQTIDRARHMLTQRSALIETSVSAAVAGQLDVAVKVTNLAGHKLPTGYAEGRRMWLHVVARDSANTVIWENGAWNPATGELSQDAQTKIYETLQGIWNPVTSTCEIDDDQGRKRFHFVLNNCIAKDNRIPPLGFRGGQDLEIRPTDHVYGNVGGDPARLVNYDISQYVIPVPTGSSGAITVTATLKFQIASDDYIHFLKRQADERGFQDENQMCSDQPGRPFQIGPQDRSRGQFIYELWNDPAYGRSPPEDMVSDSQTVIVAP